MCMPIVRNCYRCPQRFVPIVDVHSFNTFIHKSFGGLLHKLWSAAKSQTSLRCTQRRNECKNVIMKIFWISSGKKLLIFPMQTYKVRRRMDSAATKQSISSMVCRVYTDFSSSKAYRWGPINIYMDRWYMYHIRVFQGREGVTYSSKWCN